MLSEQGPRAHQSLSRQHLPLHAAPTPDRPPVRRTLNVDFAPALVGFERQGGRMVPKLQGVVVCAVSGAGLRLTWRPLSIDWCG